MAFRAPLLVLYATQTGSAAEVAARIAREAERLRFAVDERSVDDYDMSSLALETRDVVFVVSTSGQGEVPDAMKQSWQYLLRKRHPADLLGRLRFTVFGLGDSSYVQFNFAAKKLFRRLLALGATAFHPKGEGDDQHRLGVDGGLDPWLTALFDGLCARYPLPSGVQILPPTACPPSRYVVETLSAMPSPTAIAHTARDSYTYKQPFSATVVKNQRITAADWEQDVRHIELSIKGSGIRYEPGDVVCIIPQSPEPMVQALLRHTGHAAETLVRVKDLRDPSFVVTGTLSSVLLRHFDVVATPRRFFFELLSNFATEARESERLRFFASSEGQDDARDYSYRDRKTPEEVLLDFPSARPPLTYLFDLLPRIQARSFSISSAQLSNPDALSVSMVVVRWQTRFKRQRFGLCSTWLASLAPGAHVPLWVKPGTFRVQDEARPIIMVGPGTGCAIFRAYLHSRSARLATLPAPRAEAVFFFGCRHATKDYLYRGEWETLTDSGALTRLFVAFSRDQADKRYVQHVIQENSAMVWSLLAKGAAIYVSGSSKGMPEQVRLAFRRIIQENAHVDEETAERQLLQLAVSGRYCTETWS